MTAWSEQKIARAISRQTLASRCVVLLDNCNWTGYECDVLGVTMDLRIIDVEVKISRSDLKADAKKDKWWHRVTNWSAPPVGPDQLLSHPRKVWKHYYAMPKDIWKPELLDCLPSVSSGVLLLREGVGATAPPVVVECIRRSIPARDAYRLTAQEAVDIARLANLRMWEAYGRSDADRAQIARLATAAARGVEIDQREEA